MAHYHFTYYKNGEIVNSYDSRNFDTFNHAYDCADSAIRFFAGCTIAQDVKIKRTNDRITCAYTNRMNGNKIVDDYQIFE